MPMRKPFTFETGHIIKLTTTFLKGMFKGAVLGAIAGVVVFGLFSLIPDTAFANGAMLEGMASFVELPKLLAFSTLFSAGTQAIVDSWQLLNPTQNELRSDSFCPRTSKSQMSFMGVQHTQNHSIDKSAPNNQLYEVERQASVTPPLIHQQKI